MEMRNSSDSEKQELENEELENKELNESGKTAKEEEKSAPEEEKPAESEEAPAEEHKSKKEIRKEEKLAKELDELKDKYLRVCAEYDNYRKRTDKEKGDSYSAGIAYAAKLMLPVLDNLERALSYDAENEGVKLIAKQIGEAFEKLGVQEIESDGKPFDPELHNAVMHEEDEERDESVVAQTFQKGYTLGGKVIRHAMVKVVN